MMLFTAICLVCLVWAIVIGLCMKLIETGYEQKKSQAKRLYDFAMKHNLSPTALRELYDICSDE